MQKPGTCRSYNIGIYVRESRDDNEENYETIETQKGLLIEYADRMKLGKIYAVYEDDNVSGSGFERVGLGKMKQDVEEGRINLLLLKDLSRLGRNNAKTLLFLDYLEEFKVRVITFDGRYDSDRDNDTVGIETWANERFVRDISRKIRASLKYKIDKGEYIGKAPFGYKKSPYERNKLCIVEEEADIVRMIYGLYLEGSGYAGICSLLNEKRLKAPGGGLWNSVAIKRLLCNRVYIGHTVQGVSEKVSFKSHKTRRLPEAEWVVTEHTHPPIIDEVSFNSVRKIRESRNTKALTNRRRQHPLSGLILCGSCGSLLYARSRGSRTFYVCGKYYRYGRGACTSHFVWEKDILDIVKEELLNIIDCEGITEKLAANAKNIQSGEAKVKRVDKLEQMIILKQKQQETLYMDRLDERIGYELFGKMNKLLDEKIYALREELDGLKTEIEPAFSMQELISEIRQELLQKGITGNVVRCMVNCITVFDRGDRLPDKYSYLMDKGLEKEAGLILIDFKTNKVYH